MSIDNLRSALPDWAKDLSLNLSTLSRSSSLTEQQQWGTFVAAAAATRNESVLVQVMEDARSHLSEEAVSAALGAASIMAMNNVAYRTRHFLGSAYDNERMGLRMNIIGSSGGVEKVDFELWSLAVSTINGCEKCVTAHEATVRGEGLSTEQVWEAVQGPVTLSCGGRRRWRPGRRRRAGWRSRPGPSRPGGRRAGGAGRPRRSAGQACRSRRNGR